MFFPVVVIMQGRLFLHFTRRRVYVTFFNLQRGGREAARLFQLFITEHLVYAYSRVYTYTHTHIHMYTHTNLLNGLLTYFHNGNIKEIVTKKKQKAPLDPRCIVMPESFPEVEQWLSRAAQSTYKVRYYIK